MTTVEARTQEAPLVDLRSAPDLDVLLEDVRARMVRVLSSRGVDRHLAEDLAQEGTLLVWRKLPQLRSRDCLPAWVATIALNRLRSHLRRSRIVAEELPDRVARDHAEPAETAACHEGLERAARVLSLLGPECGAAVALSHGIGVEVGTACRVLGISPEVLRRRITTGLALLRRRVTGRFVAVDRAVRAIA